MNVDTSKLNAVPEDGKPIPHWVIAITFLIFDFLIFGVRRRQRILQKPREIPGRGSEVDSGNRVPSIPLPGIPPTIIPDISPESSFTHPSDHIDGPVFLPPIAVQPPYNGDYIPPPPQSVFQNHIFSDTNPPDGLLFNPGPVTQVPYVEEVSASPSRFGESPVSNVGTNLRRRRTQRSPRTRVEDPTEFFPRDVGDRQEELSGFNARLDYLMNAVNGLLASQGSGPSVPQQPPTVVIQQPERSRRDRRSPSEPEQPTTVVIQPPEPSVRQFPSVPQQPTTLVIQPPERSRRGRRSPSEPRAPVVIQSSPGYQYPQPAFLPPSPGYQYPYESQPVIVPAQGSGYQYPYYEPQPNYMSPNSRYYEPQPFVVQPQRSQYSQPIIVQPQSSGTPYSYAPPVIVHAPSPATPSVRSLDDSPPITILESPSRSEKPIGVFDRARNFFTRSRRTRDNTPEPEIVNNGINR